MLDPKRGGAWQILADIGMPAMHPGQVTFSPAISLAPWPFIARRLGLGYQRLGIATSNGDIPRHGRQRPVIRHPSIWDQHPWLSPCCTLISERPSPVRPARRATIRVDGTDSAAPHGFGGGQQEHMEAWSPTFAINIDVVAISQGWYHKPPSNQRCREYNGGRPWPVDIIVLDSPSPSLTLSAPSSHWKPRG
ncbi:hypothetical protein B0T21DRAFT_352874 [Apiosordaria backusii]|uniref:Uncharacterized protein n=1 Tax=Apiosordaria backusii TaxID=314023 RepID=A0AA40DMP9_9PEZI|nr:hypothetical protein B0T21DRAFT_352874 [Apiosordaria backusii]